MRNKTIIKTVANGQIVGGSPDAGTAGVLDTAGDIILCDTRELTNISVSAIQLVDAGTCTYNIEASYDFGVSWALVGTALAATDFPAGTSTAVQNGVSDARGMALQPTNVRARLVAVSGGGTYSLAVSGLLLDESR